MTSGLQMDILPDKLQKKMQSFKILYKLVYLLQVAAKPVIIKTISHHELVRDIETHIIELQRVLGGFGLMQKRGDLH